MATVRATKEGVTRADICSFTAVHALEWLKARVVVAVVQSGAALMCIGGYQARGKIKG